MMHLLITVLVIIRLNETGITSVLLFTIKNPKNVQEEEIVAQDFERCDKLNTILAWLTMEVRLPQQCFNNNNSILYSALFN